MRISVSMKERNVSITPKRFPFQRREAMRFEWLVLLAYARKTQSAGGGWVSIEEIKRLPLWKGKSIQHIGTNIGRYLQQFARQRVKLVEDKSAWRGPYRLAIPPASIRFDVPLEEIAAQLGATKKKLPSRGQLLLFTERYARSMSLFMEGHLSFDVRLRVSKQENALEGFSRLARESALDSRLRLLAQLGAIQVLDRLGRYGAVSERLDDCEKLARRVSDPVVVARFYLVNSRRYFRVRDDASFEECLTKAKEFAAKSPELLVLGGCADQEGVYLSSKDRNREALAEVVEGLSVRLATDNFDAIQASCFNIGNTLHRMGERNYVEAQAWLELCVSITSWLHLGRYEALAEIILAKIGVDSKNDEMYLRWIEAAEVITERTQNPTDAMWCNVIRAMYAQRAGDSKTSIDHLANARRIYLTRSEYDRSLPEKYLARKFPEVWTEVIKRS